MIFPVSCTQLSKDVIDNIARVLGTRSPLSNRDSLTAATLSCSLGMNDHRQTLASEGYELGHFFISFFIQTTEIANILSLGELRCLSLGKDAYILTSDVLTWKAAVVRGLSKSTSTEVREVMNYIFAYLRDNGFASLFSDFKRVSMVMDKTLCLEHI